MYTGLLHLHHWMPFLWLLLILVVLVQNFLVWKSDREFNASLQRQNKITLILTHIQVTVGLIDACSLVYQHGYVFRHGEL